MSTGFYMDENVPGAITSALRMRGYDVLTAQEDGLDAHTDQEVMDREFRLQRILFSLDDDMLRIATARLGASKAIGPVAHARQCQLTVSAIVEWLELLSAAIPYEEAMGTVWHLPIR